MDKYFKALKKNKKTTLLTAIFIVLVGLYLFTSTVSNEQKSYNEFLALVEDGVVEEVDIVINNDTFSFTTKDGDIFITDNPRTEDFKEMLLLNNIVVIETNYSVPAQILSFTVSVAPTAIVVVIMLCFLSTMKSGPNNEKSYLVSKGSTNTKMDNVILPNNVKKDIMRNVDFLKNPAKYEEAGAKMPKGMLLVGPPGTGKTMIAKAIANEADVPFFYASGADFIELYVGQGAKRIRKLFSEAKKSAPCVVFIDEIDAIGGTRGKKNSSENDQTINALLTSLDGFDSNSGILTIAATNRAEMLDSGLVREGRFDQHVQIPLPSKNHRKAMIIHYVNEIKCKHSIDIETLAKKTSGLSGATIKALINEALLITLDKNSDIVTDTEIEEAYEKIVFKSHRGETASKNKQEQHLCAVHEAGHALVMELLTGSGVENVNIAGTLNGAGGFTMSQAGEDQGIYNKNELMDKVMELYGGAAAEELVLGVRSTGSSNDFERATEILRDICMKFGLNGHPIVYTVLDNDELNNKAVMDIQEMADTLFKSVKLFLDDNKKALVSLASKLEEEESLDRSQFLELLEGSGCK